MTDPSAVAPADPSHALITGGSRGIGRAVAVALATAGYNISFCYRSGGEAAAQTVAECQAVQPDVRMFHAACDVADPTAAADFVKTATAELGPVEVLVPCAGLTRDGAAALMGADKWSEVIDTNLTGSFNFVQAVIYSMMRRHSGRIILMSSVAGCVGNVGQVNYAASKGGLNAMAQTLAKEVGSFGVTVNAVAPGFIETDMTAALPDSARAKILATIPVGRFGQPEDVAALVRFLAGPEASYITGQIIRVDGGIVI